MSSRQEESKTGEEGREGGREGLVGGGREVGREGGISRRREGGREGGRGQ